MDGCVGTSRKINKQTISKQCQTICYKFTTPHVSWTLFTPTCRHQHCPRSNLQRASATCTHSGGQLHTQHWKEETIHCTYYCWIRQLIVQRDGLSHYNLLACTAEMWAAIDNSLPIRAFPASAWRYTPRLETFWSAFGDVLENPLIWGEPRYHSRFQSPDITSGLKAVYFRLQHCPKVRLSCTMLWHDCAGNLFGGRSHWMDLSLGTLFRYSTDI